jgi:hypothetical protein
MEPINTSKDDRRNLIIRCSDELIGNKIFFNQLHNYLDDIDVIRTCYEYFKSLEGLDKFNSISIPKTAYQTELKKLSLTPPELYLQYLCELHQDKETKTLTDKQLFEGLQIFCAENNIQYQTTPQKLGIKLTNLNTGAISKRIHTSEGHSKSYNLKKLRELYGEFEDIFIDDNEEVKPVVINQITNYDKCTITNLNDNKTAKIKTTKPKNKLDNGIFIAFDDE